MNLAEAIAVLEKEFPVLAKKEFRGETTLTVEAGRIAEICAFAKNALGFDTLANMTSVDNLDRCADAENAPRFEVVYELYSMEANHYLRLKTAVAEVADERGGNSGATGEKVAKLASVTPVWSAANWHEREIYDLMGIRFEEHPDLRRILMWEGYPHHPLRKDFPLAGRPTDLPEVAFTRATPMDGGPFTTTACAAGSREREPRSRSSQ